MIDSRGVSLIAAGLDHWYERADGDNSPGKVDKSEFHIEEWRLQALLGVNHFMSPPDHRRWARTSEGAKNLDLKVPYLRFPQWHFCPRCKRMDKATLTTRSRVDCADCKCEMIQVPFVGICSSGHIQDVLWREWVHRSDNPGCQLPLYLVATGGASLAGQKVRCECGAQRSMLEIVVGDLSNRAGTAANRGDSVRAHTCLGMRPWLGETEGGACTSPLFVTPRDATNVYYSSVESSLYIPRGNTDTPSDLVERLSLPPVSDAIGLVTGMVADVPLSALGQQLQERYKDLLGEFTPKQVEASLVKVLGNKPQQVYSKGSSTSSFVPDNGVPGDTPAEAFRRVEFDVLRRPVVDPLLLIREARVGEYDPDVSVFFRRIMLVDKIRETRAFVGFSRIESGSGRSLGDLHKMLWRTPPATNDSWLPAYTVFGEGLFFEFDEGLLTAWEQRPAVSARVRPLSIRNERLEQRRKSTHQYITPRLVLIHTFAHLLMNRLSFECGYGAASLRERLFVSCNPNGPMAGVLVYTASGDSEGSMGGLVRMGRPGRLEPVIRRAIEGAAWCSADPVCIEAGERGGQGPNSANIAACHACGHVPETSCEKFNRFLDRGLIVGSPGKEGVGFFEGLTPHVLDA